MDRDEEESSKGNSVSNSDSNIHFHHQLHSDFAFALALHQQQLLEFQETAVTHQIGSTNPFHYEEEEEEEEEESDDRNHDDGDNEDDDDIDMSPLFNDELGYLEEEDGNDDQNDMEEDDVDPDELSYEELIALGEMVGEESRGLSAEEISSCLSPYPNPISSSTITTTTATSVNFDKDNDRCVICQVEYGNEEGEEDDDGGSAELVALPCNHPFHSRCISKWLLIKKICPICNAEVSPSTITCKSTKANQPV
ncbi:hypothetical protein NMG60_11006956 [Bertholletia excelsa]